MWRATCPRKNCTDDPLAPHSHDRSGRRLCHTFYTSPPTASGEFSRRERSPNPDCGEFSRRERSKTAGFGRSHDERDRQIATAESSHDVRDPTGEHLETSLDVRTLKSRPRGEFSRRERPARIRRRFRLSLSRALSATATTAPRSPSPDKTRGRPLYIYYIHTPGMARGIAPKGAEARQGIKRHVSSLNMS
jgi:hypothetical protein